MALSACYREYVTKLPPESQAVAELGTDGSTFSVEQKDSRALWAESRLAESRFKQTEKALQHVPRQMIVDRVYQLVKQLQGSKAPTGVTQRSPEVSLL